MGVGVDQPRDDHATRNVDALYTVMRRRKASGRPYRNDARARHPDLAALDNPAFPVESVNGAARQAGKRVGAGILTGHDDTPDNAADTGRSRNGGDPGKACNNHATWTIRFHRHRRRIPDDLRAAPA